MKKAIPFLTFLVILTLASFKSVVAPMTYDTNDVKISTAKENGINYRVVMMNRTNQRVKAKYFAFKEGGKTVYQRYLDWKVGRNIVLVSSGTYITKDFSGPEGLTVDNGRMVNENFTDKFDGLVIVQATGGIAVTNTKEKLVNITFASTGVKKSLDLKKYSDKYEFIEWAKSEQATVFQTHLLAFEDQLKVGASNSSANARERRFLAACRSNGVLYHVIVHIDNNLTLYEATKEVVSFLKNLKEMDTVISIVNLDTGLQDVFELYNSDGSKRTEIAGRVNASEAYNLLVYYYE
jgi:hypothetical protein